MNDIRTLLNDYFTSRQFINQRDQAYINLNPPLLACISSKAPNEPKKGGKGGTNAAPRASVEEERPPLEFMKRDELMKKVVEQMQSWYEVKAEGHDVVIRYVSSRLLLFVPYSPVLLVRK